MASPARKVISSGPEPWWSAAAEARPVAVRRRAGGQRRAREPLTASGVKGTLGHCTGGTSMRPSRWG